MSFARWVLIGAVVGAVIGAVVVVVMRRQNEPRYNGRTATEYLADLDDRSPAVRRRALVGLYGIGADDPRVVPAMRRALEDASDDVESAAAADLLGLTHDPAEVKAWARAHEDAPVTIELYRHMGDEGRRSLARIAADGSHPMRSVAAFALQEMEPVTRPGR